MLWVMFYVLYGMCYVIWVMFYILCAMYFVICAMFYMLCSLCYILFWSLSVYFRIVTEHCFMRNKNLGRTPTRSTRRTENPPMETCCALPKNHSQTHKFQFMGTVCTLYGLSKNHSKLYINQYAYHYVWIQSVTKSSIHRISFLCTLALRDFLLDITGWKW